MVAPLTDDQVNATRERICAIAERQFVERGPEGASMRSIAAEMGWTAASLYRYYANRHALLADTRAGAMDRLSERIEATYAAHKDLWERSRAIGKVYADFAMDEPHAYHLIFAMGPPPEPVPAELARAHARSLRTMTDYVQDMVEAGLLEGEPELLGRAYWSAMHGLIMLRAAGRIGYPDEFEAVRHETVRLITRGARPGR